MDYQNNESVDCYKVKDLLYHIDMGFGPVYSKLNIDSQYRTFLIKYLNHVINKGGEYKVNNSFTNPSYKRLYPKNNFSLKTIEKNIRGLIAGNLYNDFDIKNCHPVMLYNYCVKNEIVDEDVLIPLKDFIDNREGYIEQLKKDHKKLDSHFKIDDYKAFILYHMNNNSGKKFKGYSPKINKLFNLFENLHNKLYDHIKLLDNENVTNYKGKNLNYIVVGEEFKVIQNVMKYVVKKYDVKYEDIVNCYDGVMISKSVDINLEKLNEYINKKTEFYGLKIVQKPMKTNIELESIKNRISADWFDVNDIKKIKQLP